MASAICNHCRLALRRTLRASRPSRQQIAAQSAVAASLTRPSRTPSSSSPPDTPNADLASLLSRPTWSVRSLVPPSAPSPSSQPGTTITPKTLHHLLRLSALPLPRTPDEERQMLATLSSQLHFVRAIQGVDTAGVAPLRAIRDETARGLREQTVALADLREALALEDVVGHARRRRRRQARGLARASEQESSSSAEAGRGVEEGRDAEELDGAREQTRAPNEEENWNVLGGASETAGGRYFVVRSGGTGSSQDKNAG